MFSAELMWCEVALFCDLIRALVRRKASAVGGVGIRVGLAALFQMADTADPVVVHDS